MISTWMPTLKTKMAEISQFVQVHQYDELPHALVVFPCLLILPVAGDQDYSAGGPNIALHRLHLVAYVTEQIIPEAFGRAVPLIGLVRNKLASAMTLGGTVSWILPDQPFYEGPGGLTYADKTHLGIVFHYMVKEIETFSVSA